MNNNNFSLLRYLHYLGYTESYLYLFKDEILHFSAESDTYYINKWKKFINQMPFYNGNIINYLLFLKKQKIYNLLKGYDIYLGTGFAPALFYKANLHLHFFSPYAVGIEFIYKFSWRFSLWKTLKSFKSLINSIYYHYQIQGLKHNTGSLISLDRDCMYVAEKLGLINIPLGIPVLYDLENQTNITDALIEKFRIRLSSFKFVVYSHVSHNYIEMPALWDIKKNYITIEAFANFINHNKILNSVLVLHEYGKDVAISKAQIKRLDIEEYVIWIPLLQRKQLMPLLSMATIGVTEFGGIMWGGTGYEFISKGVPFIHYFNISNKKFELDFKMKKPPFFDTKDVYEISSIFFKYYSNPELLGPIKQELLSWFDTYCGVSLTNKYIESFHKQLKNES